MMMPTLQTNDNSQDKLKRSFALSSSVVWRVQNNFTHLHQVTKVTSQSLGFLDSYPPLRLECEFWHFTNCTVNLLLTTVNS